MKPRNGTIDLERSTSSPTMGFSKYQEAWLSRGGIVAIVIGFLFLFKFLLYQQPGLIPVDLPIGAALSSQVPETQPLCQLKNCTTQANSNITSDRAFLVDIPNSYLPRKDYIKPGSSTHELDIAKYFKVAVEDSELLHAAQDAATLPLPQGKPKVAFLFILRQKIPLEPLWERFFGGADKDSYSIYTHPSWWVDGFPENSVFYNRSISTKEVKRFDISLVDVVRRLLAFALLDTDRANMWFVLVSEACIPVRSFPFVYDYLMNSTTSFVESFSPLQRFKRWNPEPVFEMNKLRKGELWMSMHRRHAGMVVGDVTFYRKFKADCRDDCTLDEQYTQTLLHCLDPEGIANRSVTYADWSNPRHGGSPLKHTAALINSTLIEKIQNRTENLDGQYMDSSDDFNHTMQTCVYNGLPHSPCFLFARKFSGDKEDVQSLLDLPKSVLQY
ncbi:hypothetical protein M758_6G144300 [Ceratodon purpureus]|nr:hypothetical protein M758_6G144300 [Ceratodon purpureus]